MTDKIDVKPEPLTSWEKWKIISTSISLLLIPILLAFIANVYSESMKESELKVKYLELAVKILQEDPKPESETLRAWAVKLIDQYSDVELDVSTQKGLIKQYRLTTPIAAIGILD